VADVIVAISVPRALLKQESPTPSYRDILFANRGTPFNPIGRVSPNLKNCKSGDTLVFSTKDVPEN